jgi:hypothetical protein
MSDGNSDRLKHDRGGALRRLVDLLPSSGGDAQWGGLSASQPEGGEPGETG